MRKMLLALVLVLVVSSFAFAAHVDPALNGKKGMVPVIVQMNPGAKHVDVNAMGGKLGFTYDIINGFSAELPVAAIEALAKNPNVFAISYDQEVQVELNTAVCAVNADDNWASGYDGSGVVISIVDTGIYPHQDFQNRIIGWVDYVNYQSSPYDDHGHGTHCAGIAAGNGSTYDGPSRAASIMGAKVLNSAGSGSASAIINGINWSKNNGADVISISIGGYASQSSTVDPMCAAVRNAVNAGVVVVIAAGNSGSSYYTINTPGIEPLAITVGAADDKGTCSISDDTIASFSSRGPTSVDYWVKPDVAAPGVNITACDNAYSGYVTMSGTSMATPLVAGICGQILEAHPSWSPATIKTALMNTARDLGYSVYIQGAGLVDAYAALRY